MERMNIIIVFRLGLPAKKWQKNKIEIKTDSFYPFSIKKSNLSEIEGKLFDYLMELILTVIFLNYHNLKKCDLKTF